MNAPAPSVPRPSARMASRWLRIDGRELHYRRSTGPKPPRPRPVVLVHGLIAGASFEPVAELVGPYHRVHVPELPGFGGSEDPSEPLDMSALVGVLVAFLDHAGIEDAHIAAQSTGCNVAVELAVRHPERVASLTLQGLTLEPSRRSLPALGWFWLLSELREMPRGKAKKQGQRGIRLPGLLGMGRQLLIHPVEKRLPRVRAPALVLHGSHDLIASSAWARQAADLLPQGRLVEVRGGVHTMNARTPGVVADALLEFTAGVDQPAKVKKGESHGH